MNKFREIAYTDDGCSYYECLACKAKWEVRSIPTNYCPACGIRFEGELVWDHDKNYEKRKFRSYGDDNLKSRYWTIVERRVDKRDGTLGEWESVHFSIKVQTTDECKTDLEHYIKNGHIGVANSVRFLKNAVAKNCVEGYLFITEYAVALVDNSYTSHCKPFEQRLLVIKPICRINSGI